MFKLLFFMIAVALSVATATAKPQVLVDTYGYYAAPSYVASYGTPLAYSYPYAYAYAYPTWGYY